MRFGKLVPFSALALAFTVGACGDSTGSGSNTITMTNAESLELWAEIGNALSGADFSASRAGGPSLSRAFVPSFNKQVSINATVNCTTGGSGGGSVSVSGTADATATGETFNITETFNACKTTHFTLGGSVDYSGSVTSSASSFNFSLTVKGDISVSATDGRSGNCNMNFTVTESGTLQAPTITVSGTICGVQANAVITAANA
jgi:hypothetical protein